MSAMRKKGDRVVIRRVWVSPTGIDEPGTITRTTLPTYHILLDSGRQIEINYFYVRDMTALERLADI